MNGNLTAGFIFVIALTSCALEEKKTVDASSDTTDIELNGQWKIECIKLNDSVIVRPAAEKESVCQYFTFTDSTYHIMTNCNAINGSYSMNGNSIVIGDGAMTELACDNMETEDALRAILPDITTVEAENDSTIRLNSSTTPAYIVLNRITTEIK